MSILRTYNLQNPDSATTNIELTANGGAVAIGIVTATSGLNVGAGGTVITTTAGGFVGVGTDDPQRVAHIFGSASSGTNLLVETPSTNNASAGIKLIPSSGNEYEIQSVVSTAGTNPNSFIVYDRTNDAYRIVIDSSGRVTMPYQPGFFVQGSGSANNQPSSGDNDTLSPLFTDTAHSGGFNRGNHYNTSTGIFVAPVGGIYYVFANIRWETAAFVQNSYIRTFISINDQNNYEIHAINGNNEAWNSYFAQNVSGVVALNANDNLRVKGGLNGGTAKLFGNESSWGAFLIG